MPLKPLTEARWLATPDPPSMLGHLVRHRKAPTERKFRLFACACARRAFGTLRSEAGRTVVAVAERFADGEVAESTLIRAWRAASRDLIDYQRMPTLEEYRVQKSLYAAIGTAAERDALVEVSGLVEEAAEDRLVERAALCRLLCSVVGPLPFRPVVIAPAWLTASVRGLADSIYRTRDFSGMPVLADALEEAGCSDAEILGHLRGDGPHVRGDWVLDLILGKL